MKGRKEIEAKIREVLDSRGEVANTLAWKAALEWVLGSAPAETDSPESAVSAGSVPPVTSYVAATRWVSVVTTVRLIWAEKSTVSGAVPAVGTARTAATGGVSGGGAESAMRTSWPAS